MNNEEITKNVQYYGLNMCGANLLQSPPVFHIFIAQLVTCTNCTPLIIIMNKNNKKYCLCI